MTPNNFREKANFIWQVADDILRGAFKAHEYGDVILPFVVLRRLDLVLEPQKDAVIKQFEQFKESLDEERLTPILRQTAGGLNFYNQSFYDMRRLAQDSKNIELNWSSKRRSPAVSRPRRNNSHQVTFASTAALTDTAPPLSAAYRGTSLPVRARCRCARQCSYAPRKTRDR